MKESNRGPSMTTYTGRTFWPFDPRPEDVSVIDIAQSCALTTRYRGHIKEFYSTAQHQVILAKYIMAKYNDPIMAMKAQFHDSGESYTTDMVGPVKVEFEQLTIIENKILEVVFESLNLRPGLPWQVVDADHRIRYDEMRVLIQDFDPAVLLVKEPLGVDIMPCWQPNDGRQLFLEYYNYLLNARRHQATP